MDLWNKYRDIFPKRYIETGYFDQYTRKLALELKPRKILDIGGGVTGTLAVKDVGAEVYLLDPYIIDMPDWMAGTVGWDTSEKFDLIVARGSINYLTIKELAAIPALLCAKGVFVANTFVLPPSEKWQQRPYQDPRGIKGVESVRYNHKTRLVEHVLTDEFGHKISHNFFYYSPQLLTKLFPRLEIIEYKSNSAILCYRADS